MTCLSPRAVIAQRRGVNFTSQAAQSKDARIAATKLSAVDARIAMNLRIEV